MVAALALQSMRPFSAVLPPKYDPCARSPTPREAQFPRAVAGSARSRVSRRRPSPCRRLRAPYRRAGSARRSAPPVAGVGLGHHVVEARARFPLAILYGPVDGARPRYRGSSEPCMLSAPRGRQCQQFRTQHLAVIEAEYEVRAPPSRRRQPSQACWDRPARSNAVVRGDIGHACEPKRLTGRRDA